MGSQDQLEKIGTSVASAIREDVKKRGDDPAIPITHLKRRLRCLVIACGQTKILTQLSQFLLS